MGLLSVAKNEPYTARSDFESALTHCPNHPIATVGLSNILLDIYCEDLRPRPTLPSLTGVEAKAPGHNHTVKLDPTPIPSTPLGLGPSGPKAPGNNRKNSASHNTSGNESSDNNDDGSDGDEAKDPDHLSEPYKATCLPLVDRLAARDRAYALLSGLTRLGSSWNSSDAWFALARAHEESGQPDKAKEVLWWCIELEEARAVRDWRVLGGGGYVL